MAIATLSTEPTLTPKDIVQRLKGKLSVETVRALIRSGSLPATQISPRRTLVSEADLQAYLDSRKVKCPDA